MTDPQSPHQPPKRSRSLTHLYLLCLGFVALAVATAVTRRPPPTTTAGAEAQHYLYCPECGLEMTCPPEYVKEGMACPHCGAGKRMRVNAHSQSDGLVPGLASSRWVVPLVFGVPVVLAVVVFALERVSNRPRSSAQPPPSEVSCPRCNHRMASGIFGPGSTVICPECAERFKVPGEPTARKKTYKPEVIREKKRPKPRPEPDDESGRDQGPALTEP